MKKPLLEKNQIPGRVVELAGRLVPKKTVWTDAIFENVSRENNAADADPQRVRISIDTKAVINVGPYLLVSVEGVLTRASQFVWRAARTTSTLLAGVYQKGVKLCGKDKLELEERLLRSELLPWWDISIRSLTVD